MGVLFIFVNKTTKIKLKIAVLIRDPTVNVTINTKIICICTKGNYLELNNNNNKAEIILVVVNDYYYYYYYSLTTIIIIIIS